MSKEEAIALLASLRKQIWDEHLLWRADLTGEQLAIREELLVVGAQIADGIRALGGTV
jgi:hypothetical protein